MRRNLIILLVLLNVAFFTLSSSYGSEILSTGNDSSKEALSPIEDKNSDVEVSVSNKQSEKGVTQTKKVPFSKETIDEIKKRESLQPEIIPEHRVVPFQELPPPKELKEPSPGSQNKPLYKSSQLSVSDGILSSQAPTLINNFTGLGDTNWNPPDTMGAVGPSHLVEIVNGGVGVFDKPTGGLLSSVTLRSFWSSLGIGAGQPADFPFDPKVLYDQHSGSFIAVTLGGPFSSDSWLMISVSATSDPTGTWYKWAIDADVDGTTQTNNWADYPGLGVDANYIYVTANMFPNFSGQIYSKIWVIPKAQLLSGQSTITWTEFSNPAGAGVSLQPAHTFGTSSAEYIIHEGYYEETPPRRFFKIAKITFSGSIPSWTDMGYIEVTYTIFGIPDAPQLGSLQTIQTNDSRLLNAVFRNGYLWTTHTVTNDSNTKTEIAWYQIDPSLASSSPSSAGTPVQQGRISDTNRWYYYPSIAVNSNGDVGIGFSGSSSSEYPSAYYTARASTETPGTMQSVAVLKAGLASYGGTRWGDYSATSIDPSDDLTFYTLQEYASTYSGGFDRWGTWWGTFSVSSVRDDIPPDTSITSINHSNSTSATFSFTSTETNSTFQCQIDSGGYSACSSPRTYTGLTEGSHTFYVRATDAAGNTDGTPASYTWTITDATAPDTSITSQPPNPSNSTSATFSFTSTETGSTFWCLIDGEYSASACTSPRTYTGLTEGSHTFYVWATDAAGNTDGTPAIYTWTIDTTAPDTSITSQPPNPSNSTSATFSFTSTETYGGETGTFLCQIDSGGYSACTSPTTYEGITEGSHTFYVSAMDTAGNTDESPAIYTWMIDDLTTYENIDPDNDGSQYSYGENVGWLNAEPSGNGGPGVLVGDSVLTGYIWAENVGWISLSCLNTSSCFTVNYGVLNDGAGNLSGFAWGENVGWINFAPTGGGVTVDPVTGNFSGKAWGENIGWISFSSAGPVSFGVTTTWRPPSTVSNGGFESGTSPWAFYTNGAGSFANNAAGDGSAHAAHIRITTPGTNVQMNQAGLVLESNTQYRLSFKAYSNTGHDVSISLQKHVSPYTNYGLSGRVFNLTTAWQAFTVEFMTTGFVGTVNDGRLMFWLAPYDAGGDHYYFDDVVLEKVTAAVVPPTITTQPASQTVVVGQTATFNVAATGTAPLSYQWQKNEVDISGATSETYTTPATVPGDSGATFRCIVTNAYGNATSNAATLTVTGGVTVSVVVNGGFESGTSPWAFYTNVAGGGTFANDAAGDGSAHAAHIRITTPGTNVQMNQSGLVLESNTQYRLSFKAYSNTGHDVSVSLQKHVSPYTNYGLSGRVFNLTTAWQTFTVEFTTTGFVGTVNDGRLMFWLAPYDAGGDHYYFDDVVLEKVTAAVVPPTITTQPANQTVAEGQTATFNVAATGTAPLSYQWQKNGVDISGATSAAYTTPATVPGDSGATFRCIVTNAYGNATSNAATLTVTGGVTVSVVVNGGFESGTSPWAFYTNVAGGGTFANDAAGDGSAHAAHIRITTPGTNVQMNQAGLMLEANTQYRLSFKAYSNTGHDVSISLQKHVSPYTSYGLSGRVFNLTTAWQSFTVEFTTTGFVGMVSDGRLMFWLAPYDAGGDHYYFDDVVLEKIGAP